MYAFQSKFDNRILKLTFPTSNLQTFQVHDAKSEKNKQKKISWLLQKFCFGSDIDLFLPIDYCTYVFSK